MDAMLRERLDSGFGHDPFNAHGPRPVELVAARTRETLRRQVARRCPRVPGVYGMINAQGDLVYVGKSKALRSRLLSYFAGSARDDKGGRIIEGVRAIRWETQPSDFAAILREQFLIRKFTPRWNVQGVPDRQRPVYLCLGRKPAATFYLSRIRPTDCLAVEGPFFGVNRMNRAVDALNKAFLLRDCSQQQGMRFAEQLPLFELDERPGCLRWELGTCLGPCIAACRREDYDRQVAAAVAFLAGQSDAPIVATRRQMETAAANRQFELAARSRDTLRSLEYVRGKLARFAAARRDYSFVYAAPAYDSCVTWYLIRQGELAEVTAAPRDATDYASLRPTLRRWKAILAAQPSFSGGEHAHTLPLVTSWFRKYPGQRSRTFCPRQAGRKYLRPELAAAAG